MKTQRVAISQKNPAVSGKLGTGLKLANQLANEGRLEEALRVCENYLNEHRSSVEALFLMGVICDAKGERDKAVDYYRKVLYLEPEHYESLMHLSYAAERQGDADGSQNLRARAQRVKARRQHV